MASGCGNVGAGPCHNGQFDDLRLSWDRRWVALRQRGTLYIAPFSPGKSIQEHERVPIVDVSSAERATGWSPDSALLYLLLERDGFRCLYAVRIDPRTGRPTGACFPVHHFHEARFQWGSTSRGSAVVTGLFISGQDELNGNVWMTNLMGQYQGTR